VKVGIIGGGWPGGQHAKGYREAGGFKIVIEDRGDSTLNALQNVGQSIVDEAQATDGLTSVFTSFRADTPWVELIIDRAQAKDRGVSIDDVRTTLESTLGPYYINDFNRFGRTWQVNVQASGEYRQSLEDVKQLKVRNGAGDMVPMADFASVRAVSGPVMVMRYNMYPSAAVHADGSQSAGRIAGLSEPGPVQMLSRNFCCAVR
jgi:multidrug efflux pump